MLVVSPGRFQHPFQCPYFMLVYHSAPRTGCATTRSTQRATTTRHDTTRPLVSKAKGRFYHVSTGGEPPSKWWRSQCLSP